MKFGFMLKESEIFMRYREQANREWEPDINFFSTNKYLLDNLKNLRICHVCFELYGKIRLEDGQTVSQGCKRGCRQSTQTQEEEEWRVNSPKTGRHYDYDFNNEYEICYSCGLEIIPSGTRWSSYFCRPCKEMIRQFNQKVGECIIPIGRHGLMNGVSLSAQDVNNEDAINDFLIGFQSIISGIDIVDQNRIRVTRERLQQLRLGNDPTAINLVLKTERLDRNQLKEASVIELIANATGKTSDEIKSISSYIFT